MISKITYCSNLELVSRYSEIPGAIVECGTWKGGMIAGVADLLGEHREYMLYDSFEGLPDAAEIDGKSAISWQSNTEADNYFDNCTAAEDDAHKAMELSKAKKTTISKGWFCDTLPKSKFEEGISLLRMDGDWYESTMDIMNNLFPSVNKGGLIIIDDYYMWDGCSKAIHDYLSKHKRTERIESYNGICFIIKRAN